MILAPGMYSPEEVPRTDYERLSDYWNWSRVKLFKLSAAHFREEMVNPSEDTDPRKRGRAVHLATFEPERFRARYVVWEGRRAGGDWEAFRRKQEQKDLEILTEGMHEEALTISKAVRSHLGAMKYLEGGRGEHTLIWRHDVPAIGAFAAYEMNCKARPDFLSSLKVITDLKTTRDASKEGFNREVKRYGYHGQAAMYQDAVFKLTGERWPYVIVAVESKRPYPITICRVSEEYLQEGRALYRGYLAQLHECLETGVFPPYATEEIELLPEEYITEGDEEDQEDPTGLGLAIGG